MSPRIGRNTPMLELNNEYFKTGGSYAVSRDGDRGSL